MKSWTTPIRILVIFLAILALGASLSWAGTQANEWLKLGFNLAVLHGSSWLTFMLLQKMGLAKVTRWEHRFITVVILFLLFDASLAWWLFPFLGIMSEALQRLIRMPTGPVFNPAALTAVIATLFGFYPGWWGVSYAPRIMILEPGISVAILLTLPVAGFVAWKYKKLQIVAAALTTFSLFYILIIRANPLFLIIEGTLAFFFLVMTVEPKTSPVLLSHQLIFGGSLGILMVVALTLALPEPSCIPLLVCNGAFNLYRNRKWMMSKLQFAS